MSQLDTAHAWWSRLRHQGLLVSPVVMVERYPTAPPPAKFPALPKLRDARTRFDSKIDAAKQSENRDQAAILGFTDALLESFIGHTEGRLAKQHSIPENLTSVVRIGTRTETIRPHRVVFADEAATTPALLVMADSSPQVGRGRGRTVYSRFLELLRGTGHRLGLLTNGQQFRLVYAGLDFESWCEWESDRWFDEGEGTEELCGLRQLLSPESLKPIKEGVSGLLDGVEESRKRQADLSSVLRENVRQAVELLLEEVSTANRTKPNLFALLIAPGDDRKLTDAEAHEAMFQATVRLVMRLVVCLFAESRQLLPINDPIYAQSYGVRSLYELLDEVARYEGGTHALFNRQTAWHRLMALFRLIYSGSGHGAFPMRAYGGVLFRPGDENSTDAVARALYILEHNVLVGDSTIYYVLRKLLRGPLPVIKGKSKTFVDGPVDYTDLRTEFIGLIYEGLLDYRLKRTDEQIGPQIFLNLGREPVLPLARLEDMLANDKKGLKDLLTTLRKEKVTATAADEEEEAEEDADDVDDGDEETTDEIEVEADEGVVAVQRTGEYLDSIEAAKRWASEAVVLAGLIGKQKAREPDSEYQARIEVEATKLIKRVVATGEFYLVRAGNTRKGTGTFYTRPQLAVPTVHRTLEPLCYEKAADGTLTPKKPEDILALKVCDPACGSASFLVAALHYLTDTLYKSLCHHRKLEDPSQSKKITLPYGRPRTNKEGEELVPFPPNDPQLGDVFAERIKALLRRHVVERCIYGVDINSLAIEFARVSLWVETLDPELPFSFLDHKIKVGNSLVGCWLDRVEDYPLKAWEREGGDGKDGPRTQRIEEFLKGEKIGNRRSGDGRIKKEMRQVIDSKFSQQPRLFTGESTTTESVVALARAEYEQLHDLPIGDPDERERFYREHIERSQPLCTLKSAMDEWCAVWFWPADEDSLKHVPTPVTFHTPGEQQKALIRRLESEVQFFHWELEFPDVFTTSRSGFDCVLGNPPWDTIQQQSVEFFSEFDPLYRTYGKQQAIRQQHALFTSTPNVLVSWELYCEHLSALNNWFKAVGTPYDVELDRGRNTPLATAWSVVREKRITYANRSHPFLLQGSGKTYSYRAFLETSWHLLQSNGRLGMVIPTGFYYDLGSKDLRAEFLFKGTVDLLYAFQNEKKVFVGVDHSYKQAAIIAVKSLLSQPMTIVFRMGLHNSPSGHEIPHDIMAALDKGMTFTTADIKAISPDTFSLIEVGSSRELSIFKTIYLQSRRLGATDETFGFQYGQDFNMTSDSKHFLTVEQALALGMKPNEFGQWQSESEDVAFPLYEGSMLHQCDACYQTWESGHGAGSLWREISHDEKRIFPRYVVRQNELGAKASAVSKIRIAYRTVARNHARRTMLCSPVVGVPCGNSISTLTLVPFSELATLAVVACLNTFCFDFVVRIRNTGLNQNWFIIKDCPLPKALFDAPSCNPLAIATARLSWCQRRFAPQWLRLKCVHPELGSIEWKHWWAVTQIDRLRLRVQMDAVGASLYGLSPDEFSWIVRDDRKEPRSFYRVDSNLPFPERLTGLAAAAFHAMNDGKWSAESVGNLSNDEFFEIIGIPQMTTGPEPLIRKRNGCHVWKPEEFGPDDPRFGWTWDHCWQDAVALLGSEEAVQKYIEGDSKPANGDDDQPQPDDNGPKDLFGNPIPTDLFGNELRKKPRKKRS
jgi:hypothetical protein